MKSVPIILLLVLCLSCLHEDRFLTQEEAEEIYKRIGVDLPGYFRPEILIMDNPVYGIYETSMPNTALVKNDKGEFCLFTIDNAGNIGITPIIDDYPPYGGETIRTDSVNNIVWQREGRYIRALEITSKQRHGFRASGDVGCTVNNIFMADPARKILFVELVNHQKEEVPFCFYTLYDMANREILYTSPYLSGQFVPFANGRLLHYQWISERAQKWFIKDLYLKNSQENKLTKMMTAAKIEVSSEAGRSIHLANRLIIGSGPNIRGKDVLYSITWDAKFENPKVEPAFLQVPKLPGVYDSVPVIAYDGAWMKVTYYLENSPVRDSRLLFYHVSPVYPQHLSLPLMGAYTGSESPGAFMNHQTWGPLYLEMDFESGNKLFVYKLNHGLKLLAQYGDEICRE